MIRRFLLTLAVIAGLAAPTAATCPTTGYGLNLEIPSLGDSGATWSACIRRDLMLISSGTMPVGGSLSTAPAFGRILVSTISALNGSGIYIASPTITVGIASFTATGNSTYSVITASGVKTTCITFADSTVQCTKAASGTGDMILASTQTVSAAKIHTSSVTAGPTVHVTTATTGPGTLPGYSGVFVNAWQIVASTEVSGSNTVIFTGLMPDKSYWFRPRVKNASGPATMTLRINNDTGANYEWAARGAKSDNTADGGGNSGQTSCQLHGSWTPRGGDTWKGDFFIDTGIGDGTYVQVHGRTSGRYSADSRAFTHYTECFYDGASNLSSITLISNQSLSGTVELLQLITVMR